jgi:hypothetical protein
MIFTKEMLGATGLVTNQVFLKCGSDFWPCVIYSSSFQRAKIIANTKTGILKKIEQANNTVSLRYCFRTANSTNPVPFFVTTKLSGAVPYKESTETALITLQFVKRPPDDLIEIVGRVLDANINSKKRKEERVPINPDSIRRLGLETKECVIFIENVPRHCILRDISFTGAKVIMVGVEKFLINRNVELRMDFNDPKETVFLKGRFIRGELVEGRKELVALVLNVDESKVPMGYKIRINDYISQLRSDTRSSEKTANQSSVIDEPGFSKSLSKPVAALDSDAEKPEPAAKAETREGKALSPKHEETLGDETLDNFELDIPDTPDKK